MIQHWQNSSLIDITYSFFAFLVPENVYFVTNTDLLRDLEAEILALIDITWCPSLKSKMAAFGHLDYVAPLPE